MEPAAIISQVVDISREIISSALQGLRHLADLTLPYLANYKRILLLIAAGMISGMAFRFGWTVIQRGGTLTNGVIMAGVGYAILATAAGTRDIGIFFLAAGGLLAAFAILKGRFKS